MDGLFLSFCNHTMKLKVFWFKYQKGSMFSQITFFKLKNCDFTLITLPHANNAALLKIMLRE